MINDIKKNIIKLLLWIQKWTKTDMIYLARGGFWLTFGKIISAFSSFLLSIIFANLLTKDIYGVYKYILSIAGILTLFSLSGIETALIRSIAQGFEGSYKKALKVKIKWGAIGGLASMLLSLYYYLNNDLTLSLCFVIAAFFLPFMDPLAIYCSILSGKKDFKLNSIYSSISQVVPALIMILILLFTKNIFLVVLTYFAANTTVRLFLLLLTIKKLKLNNEENKETLSFGKHLSLMGAIGSAADQLDKILMFHFLGSASLATYSFALAPVSQLKTLLKSTTSLALPKLSERKKDETKKTLPPKLIKFFLLLVIIVFTYILISPFLYKIIFPQYIDSIKYTQLYALILLLFPQKLISAALTANGRKKPLYIISITEPTIRICLLFILLPLYGIYGAIFAQILPLTINTVLLSYYFKKM